MKKSDVPEARIFDAAISTFHSHCQKILEKNGIEAPKLIGIETEITDDMQLMESQIREGQEFQSFYQSFREQNPEYQDFYRLVREPSNLLDLIKSLASKGVIPEKNGWFKDTEKYLEGDRNEFVKIFEEMNRPQEGKNGKKTK